jgi:cyclopropane-fatty-acyl-phospholipid synthase
MISNIIKTAERAPLPDAIISTGIDFLVGKTKARLENAPYEEDKFAKDMANFPIATHTDEANKQHYEVPSRFFELVLGRNKKYSSCLFNNAINLDDAEIEALKETCEHANLMDGQDILELGCGWGSLSLYMAKNYPNSRIISVSNSHSQRQYIEEQAHKFALKNLQIITCDMNEFTIDAKYDRIVSVEMFEHMSNWEELLGKINNWLKDDGRLFIHIFTHKSHSYRFSVDDPDDWIGQYFFSGGIMPSKELINHFPHLFKVEQSWEWNGEHYAKTAYSWLDNFDNNRVEIDVIFKSTYGQDWTLWVKRWRLFFLATAGLFGCDKGREWFVSHYRLIKA